ncbi:MAG: PD-(D/E)XK nuclease family transposase [Acidobacteria bacterium]|nr:PD-(D/E)XK nuclease family transposase [Acidobacteriota bacterium]
MEYKGKYLDPFTDYGFKRLFGSEPNKDLLIDFLNQLLPPEHQIEELTYSSNEMLGDTQMDRGAVFDIYCVSPQGEHFIVEMQKARQLYFKDRSLFYATWPIREQGPRGGPAWNFKLTPVYLIGILDFVFAEDADDTEVCHRIQLKDQENRVFYDKLMLIYLEMPKFTKTEAELKTNFDKWLYLLRHLPRLTERPAKLQERIFGKLLEEAELGKFSREELFAYENSLKHYWDMKNVIDTAVYEAEERAEKKTRQDVARNLLRADLPLNLIADTTGLSEAEIEALR